MINDFIEYWTATVLLLNGGNPYSPAELLQAQQALGWTQPVPLIMWNPPWTLAFIWPIALLDYSSAQFAWFLLHALIIFVGAQALWEIYGGSPQKSRYAWLSVLTFAPVFFVLLLGQISPLILLGLIGFLFFAQRSTWGFAGASLTLVSIKPQLLYLIWLALFLWMVREHHWRTGMGLLMAGVAVAIVPLLWSTGIYSHYLTLLRTGDVLRPVDWATPSFGTALGELLGIREMWIRWLPSIAGGIWFLWYWSRHAANWNWIAQLPIILLVSVTTASFGWTYDHVVFVPALIQCAAWISMSDDRRQRWFIIALHLLLGALLLVGKIFVRDDSWYFWVAPTFLLFYLYVRHNISPFAYAEESSPSPNVATESPPGKSA